MATIAQWCMDASSDSITDIQEQQKKLGPYGVEEGTLFTFPMHGGLIVGFRGRSGWYLDATGFRLSRVHSSKIIDKVQIKSLKRDLATTGSEKSSVSCSTTASNK